jgi:hypothetical protein
VSELTQWIAQTGPANVLAQLRSLPYWWPILTAVKWPDDVYHVVDTLGLATLDQARAWAQAANLGEMPNREVWQRLVTSPCSIDPASLPLVPWSVLDVARDQQVVTSPDYWRMNSDAMYPMPTEVQLRSIAHDCPSWRFKHTGDERFDCNKHVNVARGWLSAMGLREMAGKAGTRHFRQGSLIYGHAVLLAYSQDSTYSPVYCWWWEPQNGEIYPVSKTDLGSGHLYWWEKPDRVELALADF